MTRALLSSAAALALAGLPTAGLALTADEVWAAWQGYAADADVTLSVGAQSSGGGTLTLTGLAIAVDLDETMEGFAEEMDIPADDTGEDVTLTATISELTLTETGDGDVEVSLPATIPVTISGSDSEGSTGSALITLAQTGLTMLLSDADNGGRAVTYAADSLTLSLDELVDESLEPGAPAPEVTLQMAATTLSGSYSATGDDTPVVESSYALDALGLEFAATDPEEGGTVDMRIDMADLASQSSGSYDFASMMSLAPGTTLREMLDDGFSLEGSGGVGATSYEISATDMPESFSSSGSLDGVTADVVMNGERLFYDVAYNGLEFVASGSEIPFPQVSGGLGQLGVKIGLPTNMEAGEMALGIALRDLVVGEEIWGLIDGAGLLPRDPASAVIDLSGQIQFLVDIFAMTGDEPPAELPAEITSLDVNELLVTAGGAALTGLGAFALDWTQQPGPFGPGTPAPDGTLNLTLTGANGLMDKLIEMGLLPQEQAMMGRMMLGMIAVPGDGADALTSEITVRPDGSILANGAPLPF